MLRILARLQLRHDFHRSKLNRRAVRRAETKLIMEVLLARLVAVSDGLSMISTLRETIDYTLSHWGGLPPFLDDGRLEPDTNSVERTIRPMAKKIAFSVATRAGGETGAILSSILNTAKLDGLGPEAWLTDVLVRIVPWSAKNNQPREFRMEPQGGARSGRREGRHISRARRKTAKIARTTAEYAMPLDRLDP